MLSKVWDEITYPFQMLKFGNGISSNILLQVYDYLSMLGLKFIQVSERCPRIISVPVEFKF